MCALPVVVAQTVAGEPPKQLKGFTKLAVAVGATATATFALDDRTVSIWDVETLEKVGLHDEDLRELTIRPETLEGPFPDDTVRPDGLCCTVEAWAKTDWYPHQASRAKLTLREFPNPQGEETHFLIADPRSTCITDDELSELKGTEKTPG